MTKHEALAVKLACPIGTHINRQDLKFSRLHRVGANVGTIQGLRAKKVDAPTVGAGGMDL